MDVLERYQDKATYKDVKSLVRSLKGIEPTLDFLSYFST